MYGPKWPFLLMYGSHAMRQTGFQRVDELSTDPQDRGVTIAYTCNFLFQFIEAYHNFNCKGLFEVCCCVVLIK